MQGNILEDDERSLKEEICEALKICMDDMIVDSSEEELYDKHHTSILRRVRKYNIRLNPDKYIFGVRVNKFLGFYLREKGHINRSRHVQKSNQDETTNNEERGDEVEWDVTALAIFISKMT